MKWNWRLFIMYKIFISYTVIHVKPHSNSIWTAMASCYKSKKIFSLIFVTLIGLPGGFGAWLCSLLAKARLIISVNPWFRKPYVAARYAMGANCCLGTFRFALLHLWYYHDAKDSIITYNQALRTSMDTYILYTNKTLVMTLIR